MTDEETIDIKTCKCLHCAIHELLKNRCTGSGPDADKSLHLIFESLLQVVGDIVNSVEAPNVRLEKRRRANAVAILTATYLNEIVSDQWTTGDPPIVEPTEEELNTGYEPDWTNDINERHKH